MHHIKTTAYPKRGHWQDTNISSTLSNVTYQQAQRQKPRGIWLKPSVIDVAHQGRIRLEKAQFARTKEKQKYKERKSNEDTASERRTYGKTT